MTTTRLASIKTVGELADFFGYPDYRELDCATFGLSAKKRYFEFRIPKKSGGSRTIQSPSSELKRIQRRLAEALDAEYKHPKAVHGFVSERSILTNADVHINRDFVFNVDLKDFFASIHAGRVRGLFRAAFGLTPDVIRALSNICCLDGVLPQGAPTSPVLSNMICRNLDRELTLLAKANGGKYTRYVDDITFSFAGNRRDLPRAIVEIVAGDARPGADLVRAIESHQLKINMRKVRLAGQSSRMEVTGLTVNVRRNVRRRYVRQIDAMLHAWGKYSLAAAQHEFDEKYDKRPRRSIRQKDFREVVAGKLSFLLSVKGLDDPTYVRLATKFNRLVGEDMRHLPVPYQQVLGRQPSADGADENQDAVAQDDELTRGEREPTQEPSDVHSLIDTGGQTTEREHMLAAIKNARKCTSEPGKASPRMGAVVVREGQMVGQAFRGELTQGEHAESTLLEKKLGHETLVGTTLYVTLEPCTSRNDPKLPCADRIIERGISRVVIGSLDPNDRIRGLGVLLLQDHGVDIEFFDPDLTRVVRELNRDFIRVHRRGGKSGGTA